MNISKAGSLFLDFIIFYYFLEVTFPFLLIIETHTYIYITKERITCNNSKTVNNTRMATEQPAIHGDQIFPCLRSRPWNPGR